MGQGRCINLGVEADPSQGGKSAYTGGGHDQFHKKHATKGGIETKVAGFGDCYLYIIFRCAAPWDRGCTDSKRRRGAPGDSP